MFIEKLVNFGLSEKEAKVYLALLELEVATAHEVADKAELNRSSTYVVLESLQARGLASISGGEKVKRYIVAPPNRLIQLATDTSRKHVEIEHDIEAILPDLKSLYKGTKEKPKIRIFEGKKAIIELVNETLSIKDKLMRVYTSGNDMHIFFREYMPEYMKKRTEAEIVMHGIHPDNEINKNLASYMPKTDKSVFIPEEKYKFSSDFSVYDSTVTYVSHRGEYAISINDTEIADAVKSAFDLAFEGAEILLKFQAKKSMGFP